MVAKGVRPSYQRLRILQHLREVGGHPTADEIYRRLAKEIPTLAKATVYNTLHALIEAGFVRAVDTGDDETRYDAVMTRHGHFVCEVCGSLTDFSIDIESVAVDGLSRFRIRARNVIFKGVCPQCLAASQSEQE